MSTPKLDEIIGGYRLTWDEEQIRAQISGLNFHSNGEVKAEVQIETTRENFAPHIHRALFNFEATRSRKDLAQACFEAHRTLTLDQWQTVIESLAVRTLDKIREGEPVVRLYGDSKASPPGYLLEPFILENQINVIYAERSSAKSLLALLLAVLLHKKAMDNHLGLRRTAKPQAILYLDWEDSDMMLDYQIACLKRGMNLEEIPPIFYRHCSRPLAKDIVQIQRKCVEVAATMIIVDSLGMAVGGDLNATDPAFAYFGAVRQINLTSLHLGHTSKDKEGKYKTVYGNGYYENEPRNIWEAYKEQSAGESGLTLTLYHRKAPPFGGLREDMAFRFEFDSNKTIVNTTDPKIDRRDGSERPTCWGLIQGQFEGNGNTPMYPSEIAKKIGQKLNTVARTLKRACEKEDILVDKEGKYALPE